MRVRPRSRRWVAIVLPALVVSAYLVGTAGTALGLEAQFKITMARVKGSNVDLVKLRQQATAARKELQQATREYEQGRKRLRQARQRIGEMRRELESTRTRLEQMEQPIGAIANAAYQHSPVKGFSNVFMSDRPQATMRAAVDFAKLTRQQQQALLEMNRLLERKQRLVHSAENLAEQAQARTEQLRQQRQKLKAQSAQQTRRLIQGLRSIGLEVSRDDRLPLGCSPSQVDVSGYPNGLIPESALCPLPQDGEMLRADAAIAFAKLNMAYAEHFGEPMCVTDSYRSLASQQSLYYRKPALAAVPGTSNHGLGVAVDLCDGINAFGSAEFVWMKNNAGEYGWTHPDWAAAWGSRPEPWHWEYQPGS